MSWFFEQKIYPMEPASAPAQPFKEGYEYQVKWDGIRILAFGSGKGCRLQSKSLRDKTEYYPELKELQFQVKAREFILDGEIIALEEGRPSFHTLMRRESAGKNKAYKLARFIPVFYMVFDLLYHDGKWITGQHWEVRQELLLKIIQPGGPCHLTPSYTCGETLLREVTQRKMEGVVAKQLGTPYSFGPRKTSCWLKMKVEQEIEAVVGGLVVKKGKPVSLLLGLNAGEEINSKSGKKLQFIGRVSAGLGEKELGQWLAWAQTHQTEQSPFTSSPEMKPGESCIWVIPEKDVPVNYTEWTPGFKLRAPRVKKKVPE